MGNADAGTEMTLHSAAPTTILIARAFMGHLLLVLFPKQARQPRTGEERSQDAENQLEQIDHQVASLSRLSPPSMPNLIFGTLVIVVLSLPGRARSRRALKDQSPIDPLRSGVVLETQLGRDLPSVRGDRVQLQQVIMNLVMNAVEAMGGMDEGTRELQIARIKTEMSTLQLR
jgi:signal transduction histidine kinase